MRVNKLIMKNRDLKLSQQVNKAIFLNTLLWLGLRTYKVNDTVEGLKTQALLDHGSQVSTVC